MLLPLLLCLLLLLCACGAQPFYCTNPPTSIANVVVTSVTPGSQYSFESITNGVLTAVAVNQLYTFQCNPGYLLSGASVVTCANANNEFDLPLPQCITIAADGGCTPRNSTNSQTAACNANEMVVSGLVYCPDNSWVMGSKPQPNMQSWSHSLRSTAQHSLTLTRHKP